MYSEFRDPFKQFSHTDTKATNISHQFSRMLLLS
jgi:hypothetical protein